VNVTVVPNSICIDSLLAAFVNPSGPGNDVTNINWNVGPAGPSTITGGNINSNAFASFPSNISISDITALLIVPLPKNETALRNFDFRSLFALNSDQMQQIQTSLFNPETPADVKAAPNKN
jgi:hypothetical protein